MVNPVPFLLVHRNRPKGSPGDRERGSFPGSDVHRQVHSASCCDFLVGFNAPLFLPAVGFVPFKHRSDLCNFATAKYNIPTDPILFRQKSVGVEHGFTNYFLVLSGNWFLVFCCPMWKARHMLPKPGSLKLV